MKFISSLFVALLLLQSVTNASAQNEVSGEMLSTNTSEYFSKKMMGRVLVYSDKKGRDGAIISIVDYTKNSIAYGKKRVFVMGTLMKDKGFEITLLPGNYLLIAENKSSLFFKELDRRTRVTVVSGEKIYAKVDDEKISIDKEQDKETSLSNTLEGTLYFSADLNKKFQSQIGLFESFFGGTFSELTVSVQNNIDEPKFIFNSQPIVPISTTDDVSKKIYKFKLFLNEGDNLFTASAIGANGNEASKTFNKFVKGIAEIENERKIALEKSFADEARKKIELEKEAKLRKEVEAKNKKQEEENARLKKIDDARIAKEGDGTPDDLSCKKYGLKPSTQGYAECRMRLDLARQDSQRENERLIAQEKINQEAIRKLNADRERARERARQDELQRQYDEAEAQNAIVRNRESKCLFVKSQEYLRPALGGFFESMNRANSAYENCMAGVPQINTTCTKDAFGNISCTSR